MMRYGLYFAPATDSPWWHAGCRWLGRDAASGAEFPHCQIAGVSDKVIGELTAHARRYGFHATLKAPFRLRDGYSEAQLISMAQAFCAAQRPIVLDDMQVRPLNGFLALRPDGPDDEIGALAMCCVRYFDSLRAAPAAGELEKRRHTGLSARQEALLLRWGYPYTEEEFRFHMTLTDPLSDVGADVVQAIRQAAEQCFAGVRAGTPLVIDALTVFREEMPGAAFSVWRRFPFNAARPWR
ncbi:MAG: DUF1045 domain-containing protein [Pseudomonadota bacterium]